MLVLGSGLAGLRAALAARQAHPGCRVAVATARPGPSGSSFANPNNAWGMQVCATAAEKAAFVDEAMHLAAPGQADPDLVRLVAEESLARFVDLKDLGLSFVMDPCGPDPGAPGCFSPTSRRAAIVKNLAQVFACFQTRLDRLGVTWLPGWLAAAPLIADSGRVRGFVLLSPDESQALAVRAEATILALGGPAPLFARHLAGPGNPGYGWGLLRRAGARLVNAGFLQFFWSTLPGRDFFPMQTAFGPDFSVRTPTGMATPLAGHDPGFLAGLAASRSGHCPCSHGRPDALLDIGLASLAGPDGLVRLGQGENATVVGLFAHAGNGGAAIDAMGHTGVAGLFAAGECAGGMHGANRLGGAMVAATQVFGARAGLAAAMEAVLRDPMPEKPFQELARHTLASLPRDPAARARELARLGRELSRHAVPGAKPQGLANLARSLGRALARPRDWMLDLGRETALAIVQGQLEAVARINAAKAA